MATQKRSEQPLSKAELRAMKFMGARLEADAILHKEFIDSLEPRERDRLAGTPGLE
jgi:hypothetical protein